VKKRKIKKSK